MGLTLGGPGDRQVLGSPSLGGRTYDVYVVRRRISYTSASGLQDKHLGVILQFPIFEGKLKYEWLSVTWWGNELLFSLKTWLILNPAQKTYNPKVPVNIARRQRTENINFQHHFESTYRKNRYRQGAAAPRTPCAVPAAIGGQPKIPNVDPPGKILPPPRLLRPDPPLDGMTRYSSQN
jgi:hypothetical protein